MVNTLLTKIAEKRKVRAARREATKRHNAIAAISDPRVREDVMAHVNNR